METRAGLLIDLDGPVAALLDDRRLVW